MHEQEAEVDGVVAVCDAGVEPRPNAEDEEPRSDRDDPFDLRIAWARVAVIQHLEIFRRVAVDAAAVRMPVSTRYFCFSISEHADGERRGPVSISRFLKARLTRDLSDATVRCRSSPSVFAVGIPGKVALVAALATGTI